MMGYPLQSVLDLRRRQQEAAALRLANATRVRTDAEAEFARRRAVLLEAKKRWATATSTDGGSAGRHVLVGARHAISTGTEQTARALFLARLQAEWIRRREELDTFKAGPLGAARAAETEARRLALATRQALAALAKHEAKFRAEARQASERREDESLDEAARAVRHARSEYQGS